MKSFKPGIPVALMSGLPSDLPAHRYAVTPQTQVLRKPFSAEELGGVGGGVGGVTGPSLASTRRRHGSGRCSACAAGRIESVEGIGGGTRRDDAARRCEAG